MLGKDFVLENICPLESVREEPFIARCCRSEREGTGLYKGKYGAVVHWGAARPLSPVLSMHWLEGGDRNDRIAVVEGDGFGHEVIPVASAVLETLHPGPVTSLLMSGSTDGK